MFLEQIQSGLITCIYMFTTGQYAKTFFQTCNAWALCWQCQSWGL